MKIALSTLCLLASITPNALEETSRPLDSVTLMGSRKPLEGRLLQVTQDELVLKAKSRLRVIPREEVQEFRSVNQDLMSLMPDLREVSTALDSSGMKALAESCEGRGLPGEARLVWWSLLRLEPENEEAHKALGNRQARGNWQAKLTDKAWTMDLVRTKKPEWGKPFELSTTHFDFRSNIPWFETVRAAVMAEEIYTALYFTLGAEYGLFWPEQVMTIELHGDDSYAGGADLRATVDVESRRVSFDFEEGFQPWLFARHLDELLISQVFKETGKGRANLPIWLAIAMEESLQAKLDLTTIDAQKIRFSPDRDHGYNRAVHAAAAEPYGLSRVLNLGSSDFRNANQELQRAQAYTLYTYCLVGEGGKYRAGMQAYVAEVLEGGGSSTDFLKCLDLSNQREQREFEEAWFAWVKAL